MLYDEVPHDYYGLFHSFFPDHSCFALVPLLLIGVFTTPHGLPEANPVFSYQFPSTVGTE